MRFGEIMRKAPYPLLMRFESSNNQTTATVWDISGSCSLSNTCLVEPYSLLIHRLVTSCRNMYYILVLVEYLCIIWT